MKTTGHIGDAEVEISNDPARPALAYFPGRDYPDREVWLAKRFTPRGLKNHIVRWLYQFPPEAWNAVTKRRILDKFGKPATPLKPFAPGINVTKRLANANPLYARCKHPAKHGARSAIVRARYAAYQRTAA